MWLLNGKSSLFHFGFRFNHPLSSKKSPSYSVQVCLIFQLLYLIAYLSQILSMIKLTSIPVMTLVAVVSAGLKASLHVFYAYRVVVIGVLWCG